MKRLKILFALHILNDGYRTTVVSILPFVAIDLSLSLTQIGILGSSLSLIGMVLALPSGYIAARIGGFSLLTLSLLLYSLGFLGIAAAPHFLVLLLAFYATAVGFAFFHPVSFSLVMRLSPKEKRGKTIGNFTSVGDIGRIILPPLTLLLIPIFGWRVVVVGCALIGLGLYAVSQAVVRQRTDQSIFVTSENKGKRQWMWDLWGLLGQQQFRTVLFAAMGDSLASSCIYVFLAFLLLSRGIQPAQLVWFTGAFLVGSLSGKSLLGMAVDAFGNKRVFVVSELMMAVVLLFLVSAHHFGLFLIISYLLGIFTRGTGPVVQTMISDVVHEAHYEKAYGVSESLIQVAAVVSVMVAGVVADQFGVVAVYYMAAILATVATVPVILFDKR